MRKTVVNAKDWLFKKGQKAKLIWIGEPFKENNKWMVNAYFTADNIRRKVLLDWASIHFLSVGKYYTDGNLNNGEDLDNKDIIDIRFNNLKVEYNERDWKITGLGFVVETKSKTFNFCKNGTFYSIPIIEVIRAVLAPDRFMLNRILEMDTLENYFTYDISDNKLHIDFTSEYEQKLLKSEKVNHLAWILTNPKIFRMFNSVGQAMWETGELRFDFLFDNFNIKARVEKKEKYIRVLQIISLQKKRINAEAITISHPSLETTETTNQVKKRTFASKSENSDKELDTTADGATKDSEEIDTFMISHEYVTRPMIKKVRTGRKIRRTKEDENTEKFVFEDKGLRTTADTGGEDLVRGLEFSNLDKVEVKGELEEFIEVLKLLRERPDVKSVDIIVDFLPEGKRGKRFSRLSDGITRRRYAIGKMIMMDGRECSLIEVEREDKALSMLLLKGDKFAKWRLIYSLLLVGLVDESGNWNNKLLFQLETQGILVSRCKHIRSSVNEKENRIYVKIS